MTANKHNATLLVSGIVAGPFFVIASVLHGSMREGFDFVRHPASLLSVGDLGWVQISIFVLTGILYIACAIGLRSFLASGIGSRWVWRFFLLLGIAMIAGGVFTADPALNFPPGAPAMPESQSWHATVHGFAPILGFLSLLIAQIILARRFGSQGQKGWKWTTFAVAIGAYLMSSVPTFTGNFQTGEFNFIPLWAAVAISFGYTSIILAKVEKEGMK